MHISIARIAYHTETSLSLSPDRVRKKREREREKERIKQISIFLLLERGAELVW